MKGATTPVARRCGLKEKSVERVLTPLRQAEEEGMTGFSGVDEVLGSAIDRGDVPGVVAMAATRDGIVYQGAFGRRALPNEAAMSTDTVFWIASMTKAITSAAAMQLVEQGKLTLDHPDCRRFARTFYSTGTRRL